MLHPFRSAVCLLMSGTCLVVAAACGDTGGGEAGGATHVVQRDSAGITIIETPGSVARAPIAWSLDSDPDLQIGSMDSGGPDQFFSLDRNIVGLADGRIVVGNIGTGELRFFDSDGHFIDSFGRLGHGPGEFQAPFLIPYVSNDSLLIFDFNNPRYTLVSSDGRGYRSFTPEGFPVREVGTRVRGASSSGILSLRSTGVPSSEDGQHLVPAGVYWTSLESGEGRTIHQFDRSTLVNTRESLSFLRSVAVPFYVFPSAAIHAGGFLMTGGHAGEILDFDMNGRLVRIMRPAEAPRSITPDDLEPFIAALSRRDGVSESDARRVYAQMELPDRLPTFQNVMRDPLGWVWAELFRLPGDETKRWMIFDPEGVARGTLELPPVFELTYIGPDYLLGHWYDELEVEYVRRYRLHR